jgi:hypothetical protein
MSDVKKVVKRRFLFIETCLILKGSLQRSDIKERFDLSTAQATNDLSKYKELFPRNIEYNKSKKSYQISKTFKPFYYVNNSSNFLDKVISDLMEKEKQINLLLKGISETRIDLEKYCFESMVSNEIGRY